MLLLSGVNRLGYRFAIVQRDMNREDGFSDFNRFSGLSVNLVKQAAYQQFDTQYIDLSYVIQKRFGLMPTTTRLITPLRFFFCWTNTPKDRFWVSGRPKINVFFGLNA